MLRAALALALFVSLAGCASVPAGTTNEELTAEMIRIRPWDGRTGFSTSETRVSYGIDAREELIRRGAESVPALVAAWERDDLTSLQRRVLRATLIALGPEAHEAVPALAASLDDDPPREARRTCMTLGVISRSIAGARVAVPALLRFMDDRGDEVTSPRTEVGDVVLPEGKLRSSAVFALGSIGPFANEALPTLAAEAARTDNLNYRRACRQAMRQILGPVADAR